MQWLKEYADVIALFVTVIGGGLGGSFVLFQWRKQIRVRRTEFVYQIMQDLRKDDEITKTQYMIEYGEFVYKDHFDDNTDLETKIDRFLSVLNYICYLMKSRAIGKQDFGIFKYEITWVLKNKHVQAYLWNLHHWSKSNQSPCSFQFLIDYGLREKLFPANFSSTECSDFANRKHLDF